jgi:hypothetical protein
MILAQLAKKFSAFYGSQRFITMFSSKKHFNNIFFLFIPKSPKYVLKILVINIYVYHLSHACCISYPLPPT